MIRINENFRSLIPPLSESEYAELERSILAEGCREAITIWHDTIVDGHHRYEICTKHGLPFRTQEMEFASEDDAEVWILTNQLGRRNISDFTRIELALKRKDILLAQGREKQAHGLTAPGRTLLPIVGKSVEPHDTRQIIAEDLGWSHSKVSMAERVIKQAPEDLKDKLRHGDISINQAYKTVKQVKREQEIEEQRKRIEEGDITISDGKFDVISIDPPWPYGTEYDPNGRRAASPYPEMSLDEIKSIELPAEDDCILFLWTTHKFMRHSFEILDGWDFREVAIITWVKDRIGLGSWLRSQSEFCIMAVKGNPKVNLTNQSTIIHGPLREHSRKPDEFYKMVDSLCIGRKLDYFARQKRYGWEILGTEDFNGVER